MVPGTNRLGLLLTAGALTAQAAIAADIPVGWPSRTPSPAPVAAVPYGPAAHARGELGLGWSVFGAEISYTHSWRARNAPVGITAEPAGPTETSADTAANAGAMDGYFDLGAWYGLMPDTGGGFLSDLHRRDAHLAGARTVTAAAPTKLINPPAREVRVGFRWNFDDVRVR